MMNENNKNKEHEFILDNMIERDKSKTHYVSEKSPILINNDNLININEKSKNRNYTENIIEENLEHNFKELVMNDNVFYISKILIF